MGLGSPTSPVCKQEGQQRMTTRGQWSHKNYAHKGRTHNSDNTRGDLHTFSSRCSNNLKNISAFKLNLGIFSLWR